MSVQEGLGRVNKESAGGAAAVRTEDPGPAWRLDRSLPLGLVEDAPCGIAVVAGPEDVVVFANRAYRALAGGRPVLGRPLAELFPARAGADGFGPPAAVAADGPGELEVVLGPGQEPTYWSIERVPLRDGPDATAMAATLVIARDATAQIRARREAEARARRAEEAERLLEGLLADLPSGITIAEAPDVTVRRVSRFGQEQLQRPLAELVGQPAERHPEQWRVLRPDGTRPHPDDLPLTRATCHGEVVVNEPWAIERADGERLDILCNAGPIRDADGAVRGGVIAWRT